jgi:hypothetical protein
VTAANSVRDALREKIARFLGLNNWQADQVIVLMERVREACERKAFFEADPIKHVGETSKRDRDLAYIIQERIRKMPLPEPK